MTQQVEKCVGCKGTGSITCPICDGMGTIVKKGNIMSEVGFGARVECHECHGTGKLLCKLCGGVGKVNVDKIKTGW